MHVEESLKDTKKYIMKTTVRALQSIYQFCTKTREYVKQCSVFRDGVTVITKFSHILLNGNSTMNNDKPNYHFK